MNDYQRQKKVEADHFADELDKILAHMDGWTLVPVRDDNECAPTWRTLRNHEGDREIWAQKIQRGSAERFEFQATLWPKYTDEAGHEKSKSPRDCYQPNESTPTTTAAREREPRAIAKQIFAKIIPDYDRIFERLESAAKLTQEYHDETADALKRLAAATGNEYEPDKPFRSYYVRDLIGDDPMRVEFNSVGDCRISLHTDEMIEVLNFIRRRRSVKGVVLFDKYGGDLTDRKKELGLL